MAGYGYYFASLALLLAIEGKEMALTMPIIWLSYDLLLRKNMVRRMAAHWILPSTLALLYGLKATAMRGAPTSDPYYMSITGSTLASGFGIYFNMLLGTNFPWQNWCIGFVVLLLVFALLRSRLALFFQSYVIIAFLPVIFLINHRFESTGTFRFWAYPALRRCWLKPLSSRLKREIHAGSLSVGYRLFLFCCAGALSSSTKRPTALNAHGNELLRASIALS